MRHAARQATQQWAGLSAWGMEGRVADAARCELGLRRLPAVATAVLPVTGRNRKSPNLSWPVTNTRKEIETMQDDVRTFYEGSWAMHTWRHGVRGLLVRPLARPLNCALAFLSGANRLKGIIST